MRAKDEAFPPVNEESVQASESSGTTNLTESGIKNTEITGLYDVVNVKGSSCCTLVVHKPHDPEVMGMSLARWRDAFYHFALFLNQLRVLNQVPQGGATYVVKKFSYKWITLCATW